MDLSILTSEGAYMVGRWIHYMAGVVWIGLLYYFNFVQGAFFAETDAQTKSAAIRQLLPKALWWFRWGAALTFFSGVYLLAHKGFYSGIEVYFTSWGIWILTGSAMATLMAANVWFVIWPNQRVVIASANAVAGGGSADPRAAVSAAKALLASRTNVLFSIPMLFLMGAASHLPLAVGLETSFLMIAIAVGLVLLLIELNALFGKTGPLTTVKGVIHCGLALTAFVYLLISSLV